MRWLESESEVTQSCLTLCDPMNCSLPGSSHPWDFPGNSTGVGCHFLFQGIFLTQGLNRGLPHCSHILYQLNYQGRPPPQTNYIIINIVNTQKQLYSELHTPQIQSCLATTNIQAHYIPMSTQLFFFPSAFDTTIFQAGMLSFVQFIDYTHLVHKAFFSASSSELLWQLRYR